MEITHASLFSGIGACELAAEWMGWRNVFNCEINPFCRQILDYWYKDSIGYGDITKTDFRQWRGRINVLTGGFPCQPFSVAGRRRGTDDYRFLWPEMLRAVAEIKPDYVIGENVAGIFADVQSGDEVEMAVEATLFGENSYTTERQEFVVERICRDFEREGYSVIPLVIPACAVGAPHRRDRVWFIAINNATDTERRRGNKVEYDIQSKSPNGKRPNSYGNKRIITKTKVLKECGKYSCSGESWRRWGEFPTVEPVIRVGDDGLPNGIPPISISFPKWKNESLIALGNSMVPQVVYEIFLAINKEIVTLDK